MDTKIILTILTLAFSLSSVADELSVRENGKEIKIYSLENEIMVHGENVEPRRIRTDRRQARNFKPGDKVSELFADSPQGEGRIRSLPGGIIVKLDQDVDADRWFEENNLKKIKQITEQEYLIESTPGRKTLAELGTIQSLEGVSKAQPNWWTQMESKSKTPRVPTSLKIKLKTKKSGSSLMR